MKYIIIICVILGLNLNLQAQPDSRGTDFWITFMYNRDSQAKPALYITCAQTTLVGFAIPDVGVWSQWLLPYYPNKIDLQPTVFLKDQDIVQYKGIHVWTLGVPISVYGVNARTSSTDGFLCLPTSMMGNEYLLSSYANGHDGTAFALVGTQPGTTEVTISLSSPTGTHYSPYSIYLGPGSTYYLKNPLPGADFTGTIIKSNRPIAVFSGHTDAYIPTYSGPGSHIVEQLAPVTGWGKRFITTPLRSRRGDTFRFLAATDNTSVSIDGVATVINRGKWIEKRLLAPAEITASQPIQVVQYSNSAGFDGNTQSGPFMTVIPPTEQYLSTYIFTIPDKGFAYNFVNVTIPTPYVASLQLDGTTVQQSYFSEIGSSGFSYAQLPLSVTPGRHWLSSSIANFGATVYGFNNYDGYGYPAGFASLRAQAGGISILPKNGSALAGTQACFTAIATDGSGGPLMGLATDFKVSGANGGQAKRVITRVEGKAEFCYTGNRNGRDTIVVSRDELSDTAFFTWGSCNLSVSAQAVNPSCNDASNGSIELTVTGGSSPVSYVWNNGAVTKDLKGLPAGNYGVVVKDAMQCTDTLQIKLISPPQLTTEITESKMPCGDQSNGEIKVNANGGRPPYLFSLPGKEPNNTGLFSNLPQGIYTVTVSDSANCTKTETISLVSSPALIVTGVVRDLSCFGSHNGSIDVTVEGNNTYQYLWSNGSTTKDLQNLEAGTYTLTVTSPDGCSTAKGFIVTQPEALSVSVVSPGSICGADTASIRLQVTGGKQPYNYRLGAQENSTGIFTGLIAGSYAYFVTDSAGCNVSGNAKLETSKGPAVTIGVSGNVLHLLGNYIVFISNLNPMPRITLQAIVNGNNGPYNYSWNNGATTSSITVTPATSAIYSVKVTSSGGCSSEAEAIVFVVDLRRLFSIFGGRGNRIVTNTDTLLQRVDLARILEQAPDKRNFKAYPNPAGNYIMIDAGDNAGAKAEGIFFNIGGQPVLSTRLTGRISRVNISGLPQGTYLLYVGDDKGFIAMRKFIVTR